MRSRSVVFIGFRDQDNLGIGYMSALLEQRGFQAEFLDFRLSPEAILAHIQALNPLVIGLSIIFQYLTPAFARLVKFLRAQGVDCFISAGGHYPSLRYTDVLAAIPQLDCIVRFEGEYTLLELVQRLAEGQEWHDLPSIAFLESGRACSTPLRPLIEHLDALPAPKRLFQPDRCLNIPLAPIMASRGCHRDCSFCSIRQFYATPPGRVRRIRAPEKVVEEMQRLRDEQGVRIFLFADDDFALASRRDRDWARKFVACLERETVAGSVLWRMSCRADEVAHETLAPLKQAGLAQVYLGIESGNRLGLETLNKHITVEQNRQAVRVLKQLGLMYDFGFMLFDPSTTFESVLDNVRFLRSICGDGSAPIPFVKMVPYAATDIEDQLRREGRLRGDVRHPDYAFVDPRLHPWYEFLHEVFDMWAMDYGSLLARIRITRFELAVLERFQPNTPRLVDFRAFVQEFVAAYNLAICSIVESSAECFAAPNDASAESLDALRSEATRYRRRLAWLLEDMRKEFQLDEPSSRSPAFGRSDGAETQRSDDDG